MLRSGVEVRRAAWLDILLLAPILRQSDRDEINAGSGRHPTAVLAHGMMISTLTWSAFIDGRIVAMFGVAPGSMIDGIGVPWLLGTDEIDQHPRAFVRTARAYIRRMRELYPTLRNIVHADNTKAVRWLRRAGFDVMPPVAHGRGLFHPFEMR